jgi:hypothetical protein
MNGGNLITDAVYTNMQLVPSTLSTQALFIKGDPLLTYCKTWYWNGTTFYYNKNGDDINEFSSDDSVVITPEEGSASTNDTSNSTVGNFPGWFINPRFLGYEFSWEWTNDGTIIKNGSTAGILDPTYPTRVGGGALKDGLPFTDLSKLASDDYSLEARKDFPKMHSQSDFMMFAIKIKGVAQQRRQDVLFAVDKTIDLSKKDAAEYLCAWKPMSRITPYNAFNFTVYNDKNLNSEEFTMMYYESRTERIYNVGTFNFTGDKNFNISKPLILKCNKDNIVSSSLKLGISNIFTPRTVVPKPVARPQPRPQPKPVRPLLGAARPSTAPAAKPAPAQVKVVAPAKPTPMPVKPAPVQQRRRAAAAKTAAKAVQKPDKIVVAQKNENEEGNVHPAVMGARFGFEPPNSKQINVDVHSEGSSCVKENDMLVAYCKDSGNVEQLCGVANATANVAGNAEGTTDSLFFLS